MTRKTDSQRFLWSGFAQSAEQFPDRTAIEIAGGKVTYGELADRAKCLAATIQGQALSDAVPLTAVFVYRSETAYGAVLGALMAGHGYVPLNRTFPVDRSRLMLQKSMCRSVIVDAGSEPQLDQLLSGISTALLIICPDREDTGELVAKFPMHRFLGKPQLSVAGQWRPVNVSPDSVAYLLFTSGSTGLPKGVMVSHANAIHYLDYITGLYGFTREDRVSQVFDLTFDLSVHDMFVTWQAAACLCCPTQKQTIKADAYLKDARLTVWFSVPSTAIFMRRLGLLKPDMYPALRLMLFCGEALPAEIMRDCALAAPNAVIENLYGPTELTIACSRYRWHDKSLDECEQGIVPIGQAFENMQVVIVDEHLRQIPDGVDGELLMTGPQLSLGYWQDQERTKKAFVQIGAKEGTYYRTGDRVRRRRRDGLLHYLGRLDTQIKVLGHRVELAEIESAIREISGLQGIVAIGWPLTESGANGIQVFVEADRLNTFALTMRLRERLPAYMLPRNIRLLDRFPLNANGKYDRRALQSMLQTDPDQMEDGCAVSVMP